MKEVEEDVQNKKRRRQERNRESARECRKRKKERKTALAEQLARLEADNLRLRLQLQVGKNCTDIEEKSAHAFLKLSTLIQEEAHENDIKGTLGEIQEHYADYGRDRRSAIDFHIVKLRKSLEPTQTTRSILWLMKMARSFHEPSGDVKPLTQGDELSEMWHDLLSTIEPSLEQRKTMMSFIVPMMNEDGVLVPDPFVAVDEASEQCNSMVNRLSEIICNKNESLDSEMENIQSILTSTQVAKFVLWIDQNPACIQMLESLWPHLTYRSDEEEDNQSDDDSKA